MSRPNIILILADDMGYGDCSCYGSTAIHTPHLDALAANGLRCTDFHSNGAVCSPTRAALLTGRYQQRCGIGSVISAANHRHIGLPDNETTFAQLLQADDYRTGLFGKWHLGYEPRFNPTRRGFDQFRGFVSGNIDYHSHIDQVGEEDWWAADALSPEDGYTTDLVTEHGLRFIEENHSTPFCLYLAHECPHYPYQGPADAAYRTPGNGQPAQGPRQDHPQAYKEMMESMDNGIGRIIAAVEAQGIAEQTLIFFFSDNGPSGPGSSGSLRGGKGTLWEGGHRVPAMACWPGVIAPGTETGFTAMGMDLFPTMMAIAGVELPAGLELDGRDLSPILQGQQPTDERTLFWRHHQQKAVRAGRWKLVTEGPEGAAPVLFDLTEDIGEKHNIAAAHPETVDALLGQLTHWEQTVASGEQLS